MYLVYTTKRRNRTEVAVGNEEKEVFASTIRQQETTDVVDPLFREKLTTFLFNSRRAETDALFAAQTLAVEHPGEDVYIAKVTQVVSAVRPEVVIKSVSEKGVLPA